MRLTDDERRMLDGAEGGIACRDVDYGQLRERLLSDGAYLGEEW